MKSFEILKEEERQSEFFDKKYLDISNYDIYDELTNSFSENDLSSIKKIEYIEAYIFYIAKKDYKTDQEDKQIAAYKKFVIENVVDYNRTPFSMMDKSLIDGKINSVLKNHIFLSEKIFNMRIWHEQDIAKNYLFDENNWNMLINIKKNFDSNAKIIYLKYMNDFEIDDYEKVDLNIYLYNLLKDGKYDEVDLDGYYDKLIKSGEKLNREQLLFVIKYATIKNWEFYEDELDIYLAEISEKGCCGISHSTKNIVISTEFVDKPFIPLNKNEKEFDSIHDLSDDDYLCASETLFHEIQHQRQKKQLFDKKINLSAFYTLVCYLIRVYGDDNFDEYRDNYYYKEIETEANIIGCFETYKEAERLNLNSEKLFYMFYDLFKKKNSKAIQNDGNDNSDIIVYNLNRLSQIIKDNPNLYYKYPLIKTFFLENGDIKGLNDFVSLYTENDIKSDDNYTDFKNIYNYIFKYYVYNHDTSDFFDIDNLTDDDKISLVLLINQFLSDNLANLRYCFDTISIDEYKEQGNENIIKKIESIKKMYYILHQFNLNGMIDDLININEQYFYNDDYRHRMGNMKKNLELPNFNAVFKAFSNNSIISNNEELSEQMENLYDFVNGIVNTNNTQK